MLKLPIKPGFHKKGANATEPDVPAEVHKKMQYSGQVKWHRNPPGKMLTLPEKEGSVLSPPT